MGNETVTVFLSTVFAVLMVFSIAYWYRVRRTYGGDRGIWNAQDTAEGRVHFRRLMGLTIVTFGWGGVLLAVLPDPR